MFAMFTRRTYRTLVGVGVLTLGIVSGVSAQTGVSPSPSRGAMEELLAEVRSLRAEIRRAADTSIRAQLLVARLQLQEQRINSLARQLVDVQRQLSENDRARGAMAAVFTREDDKQSVAEREAFEHAFAPLTAQLKVLEKADRDLQAQQTHLNGLISEEQSRWETFNAMLDELGKPVEVKTGR